jgi:haloacid dehalogenase-like hydrolase
VVKALGAYGRTALIIAYNGGVIANLDASPWIQRQTIDPSAFRTLLTVCRRLNLPALAYTCVDTFDIKGRQESVFTEPHLFATAKTEFNGMPVTRVPDLTKLPPEDIVAVLVSNPWSSGAVDDLANQLRKECGSRLRVTSSGGKYVEIAHPNSTKRHAMEVLCDRLGVTVSEVMAIGDNFNLKKARTLAQSLSFRRNLGVFHQGVGQNRLQTANYCSRSDGERDTKGRKIRAFSRFRPAPVAANDRAWGKFGTFWANLTLQSFAWRTGIPRGEGNLWEA